MNIITLVPVKNESWILESSLKNFSVFSDHIIVADQMSIDGSREICKKFPKVTLIDNLETHHNNKVRWSLLEEARKIPGNNLIFCLDADETIPFDFFNNIKEVVSNIQPGTWLEFEWIQLWKGLASYRVDGVWADSWKPIAFYDDRILEYPKEVVVNDHTQRIPGPLTSPRYRIKKYPLLHFQFVAWKRNEMKQAWYRCNEYIQGGNPRRINTKYSVTLENKRLVLRPTPTEWLKEISLPENISHIVADWHRNQILKWFEEYGIAHFEPLQIWHLQELHDQFVKKMGREPKPKTFPIWLIKANELRHKLLS